MEHETTLPENRSIPALHEIKSPIFESGLQLVKILPTSNQTPQNLALLTLLYGHLQEKRHLQILEDSLWSKAEIFLNQSPRDQSNQPGKVLIAACCIYSKEHTGKLLNPTQKKNVYEYMTYASNQNWFDDSFLAYYCHHLANEISICNTAIEYFQNNYARFIERGNIAAMAQSLLVLGNKINQVERERCYQFFKDNWRSSSQRDLAWMLLTFSSSSDSSNLHISQPIAHKIIEHLNKHVETFVGNSFLLDALILMNDDLSQFDLDKYVQSLQVPMVIQKEKNDYLIRLASNENKSTSLLLTDFVY